MKKKDMATVVFNDQTTGDELRAWTLNPSQDRFWTSQKKVVMFSGGFGCGKSLMLILKAVSYCLSFPGNFVLMGRKTYPELRDSLIKEFLVTCPQELYDYKKSELKATFTNGSEIIFRHLDKIAENEIRSLNLGSAFIDQAEDIEKGVFHALLGRLRRANVPDASRQIFLSMNPELTWHYGEFKQNPKPDYELIEASTYENAINLPPGYIENLERSYPEDYRRQYLLGVWDESLLSKNAVFDREYIELMFRHEMKAKEEKEGLAIYADFIPGHRYQMGIDVAEGTEEETNLRDQSSITVVDLDEFEEVAHWSDQVPPDIVGEKAAQYVKFFQNERTLPVTVIPEMNAIGLAVVQALKRYEHVHVYHRDEFDVSVNKWIRKLGWRTTRSSKPLLVSHFKELLRKKSPKVRTAETLAQFKTFVYSSEARKSGMGARAGFHDDDLMSCLLAFFEKGEVTGSSVLHPKGVGGTIPVDLQPTLVINKDGKAQFKGNVPALAVEQHFNRNAWTTT